MITRQRIVLTAIAVSGTFIVVSVAAGWGLIGGASWLLFVGLVLFAARGLVGRPEELKRLGQKLTWANTTLTGFFIYVATIALLLVLAFWLG